MLVPGDMGRYSFLCVAQEEAMDQAFGSIAMGLGGSRAGALRAASSRATTFRKSYSSRVSSLEPEDGPPLPRRAPSAYKDAQAVVYVCHQARAVFQGSPAAARRHGEGMMPACKRNPIV